MNLVLSLFACALALLTDVTQAKRRNLTEITYRFTNCQSANHDGPRVNSKCIPLYEEMNSPLGKPGTVFRFEDGSYDGAQGFHLPRDGLYNITVAGASGGEGVCNYHYGLGGVISAQVRLTTDHEYLILVGHKGTSVCDVPENADHPICQRPRPKNLTEARACDIDWFNWTTVNVSDSVVQFNRYNFNGGGGGGGASMIWPRTVEDKQFNLPIVISPGGGGASAALDYDLVVRVLGLNEAAGLNLSYPSSASKEEIYSFHTNGHIDQYFLGWQEGWRGYRSSEDLHSSGTGSGWNPSVNLPLQDVDGKLLSQSSDFAEGGSGCSSALQDSSAVFTNVFGGYGGGGGGCGSGGGGGGYTGGHVLLQTFPGSGGDAGVFTWTQFQLVEHLRFNDGDGYVEIVLSNCGCDGECVVYNETREFECLCPNGALLARDRSSCYHEQILTVFQAEQLNFTDMGETYYINGLQFNDSSFFIFGLNVSLSVSPKPGSGLSPQEVACAVVFVGEDFHSVLASNPVRAESQFRQANQLSLLHNGTSFIPASSYISFLDSPVLVTGAYLVTNGDCSAVNPFNVQISTYSDAIPPIQDFEAIDFSSVASLARILLTNTNSTQHSDDPTSTSVTNNATQTMSSDTPTVIIVGAMVGSLLLITILFGVAVGLLYLWKRLSLKPSTELDIIQDIFMEHNRSFTKPVKSENGSIKQPASSDPEATSSWMLSEGERERYRKAFSSVLISYNTIILDKEIGHGAFGVVYKAILHDERGSAAVPQDIAIKTIKDMNSSTEVKAFLEESLLMKDFKHPNILGLAGVCFDTPDGVPFIILPFMANGSLKDYLKKKRTHLTNVDTLPEDLSVAVLTQMCMDIVCGMEYLAEEKFVHRDLAARNCLVGEELRIKVGDFGLARDIYTDEYYRANRGAKLPVKWMAPETLLDGISNEKTDIWSFGVTCWEVFSLGHTPYPAIENAKIVDYITKENHRLKMPSLCPRKMYELAMSQSWQLLPEERPTFSQLVHQLQEYWEEEHAYI